MASDKKGGVMKNTILIALLVMACLGCTSFGDPVPGHKKDQYFVRKTTTFLWSTSDKLLEFKAQSDGRWLYVETRLPVPPEDNPVLQKRKKALEERKRKEKEVKKEPKEDGYREEEDQWGE
jgi:hypothetical protein